MEASDKAQAWRMAWTWTAASIAVGAGVLASFKIVDTTTVAVLGGIVASILAGTWVKRPGDIAGPQ